MRRLTIPILFLIIILGLVLRLYRLDSPVADWHSWRQSDTSAVSRNFANHGFDVLHPRFDDLSNVPSGLDNPQGYRFVEFPIYNVAQAGLFKIIGVFSIEEWGRIVTIFSSLSSAVFIFLILKKHQNEIAGLFGAFFFAALPNSIYYGRTILPDPSTATAVLIGIYFFDLWIDQTSESEKRLKYYLLLLLAIIFTALALLLKPFAAFFFLPTAYLIFDRFKFGLFKRWEVWLFAILSILPLFSWRMWINQFPEGIPVSAWLFNAGNIRFKGAYFYWIFGERIGKLILGYWGLSFFVLGLIAKFKSKKDLLFFYAFIASSLAYLVIVARGNVQHDYYQILIIPTICIFLGLGAQFLLNFTKTYTSKYIGPAILFITTIFTFLLSWYYVRDYFNINNHSIVSAGDAVDKLTPKDAKVIANYNGDTSFLYQTKRQGWASYEKDLPGMIELGAGYLVLANPVPSDFNFAKDYLIIKQTPEYVIFDLHKSP